MFGGGWQKPKEIIQKKLMVKMPKTKVKAKLAEMEP